MPPSSPCQHPACEIWQLFCSFTPHCEQASDSLIRNLALINLINISVSVSQAPSSVFGTAVRAWRRQGTRVNKTADSPNRKPMSPLMSASRLHFFLPLLCGGNTVRSVEEQEGSYSIARTCSLAVVRCSCGRCARSQIVRDIISSSRCHLLHQHQHQRSTVLAYLFNLHLRAFRQLSTDLPTQHHFSSTAPATAQSSHE